LLQAIQHVVVGARGTRKAVVNKLIRELVKRVRDKQITKCETGWGLSECRDNDTVQWLVETVCFKENATWQLKTEPVVTVDDFCDRFVDKDMPSPASLMFLPVAFRTVIFRLLCLHGTIHINLFPKTFEDVGAEREEVFLARKKLLQETVTAFSCYLSRGCSSVSIGVCK